MIKARIMFVTLLFFCVSLFVLFAGKAQATELKDGDLIKTDGSSIYQLNNGKRDVLPFVTGYDAYKGAVMNSRSLNESSAKVIPISELTLYPLGKNLTVKPNANYLLKKQAEDIYFTVTAEALLTEVNKNDYSNYFLVTIPNIFLSNYSINEAIVPSGLLTVSKTGTGSGTVFEGAFLEMGSVINCGSTCSASFLPNSQTVTLTAAPADGSVFTSWTGCGSNTTNPVCTFLMNENKNIVANFSAANSSLPDIVADNASFFNSENKTLIGTPKAGEKFYLWLAYKNIGKVKTNNTAFYVDVYVDEVFNKKLKASNKDYLSDLGNSMGVDEKLELALKEGPHKIKFVLDADNNINESNEGNNVYIKEINVGGVKTSDVVVGNNSSVEDSNKNVNPVTSNNDKNQLVLQLQRKISELESKVIQLETKATQLDQKFADKYAGTMFLDVENQGRLWYVDPTSKNRYYFENGASALSIGSKLATGVSYDDIQKIPVGVPDKLYNLTDSDNDGLPDNLEVALGLNPNNADTDGDGINDKTELNNGYNPAGSQKYVYDKALTTRLEGKMLLQVSGPNSHGEIWYISKGKRWYGGTQDSMYEVMKAMSLGATPENIRKIEVGGVSGTE